MVLILRFVQLQTELASPRWLLATNTAKGHFVVLSNAIAYLPVGVGRIRGNTVRHCQLALVDACNICRVGQTHKLYIINVYTYIQ
jgi:hypothetical protein